MCYFLLYVCNKLTIDLYKRFNFFILKRCHSSYRKWFLLNYFKINWLFINKNLYYKFKHCFIENLNST